MPGLVRKLLIVAAAEGVLLQPVTRGNQSPTHQSVKIDYKTNAISTWPCSKQDSLKQDSLDEKAGEALEAHGVVGFLKLASASYLISISSREQVAQIRGRPIYVITDVALIPLNSRADAQKAISHARNALHQGKNESINPDDSSDSDEDDRASIIAEEDADSVPSRPPSASDDSSIPKPLRKASTVVTDVIQNKGSYGRFANKWFSKAGWKSEGRRKQGMSSDENLAISKEQNKEPPSITKEQERSAEDALPNDKKHEAPTTESHAESDPTHGEAKTEKSAPSSLEAIMQDLTPRILSTTKLFFASRSFYFSYDYDISRSLSRQDSHTSSLPLYKRWDPLYFWNHNLIQPLISSAQSAFVLPLLQGFVGQRAFTIAPTDGESNHQIIDSKHAAGDVLEMQEHAHDKSLSNDDTKSHDFLLTLISRRSIKRAGLRYMRRGVDDQGNVANAVETEQILSPSTWDTKDKVFSFMQIRGSIPLFFSQSPYAFKPIPIQYGSEATNQTAFKTHFENLLSRYGSVYCTSLVDKHANELKIGQAYEDYAKRQNAQGGVNGKQIGFEWFDFHGECKGMKFENVSILMNTLASFMDQHKWTTQQNSQITQSQTGVLRVNCMDCLDRTNVTQSASAGQILQKQLEELGLSINLQSDPKTAWFNTLWADNGDAISRQYAGTAALKGDFTRTRKRNWTGALSDFSLTLNRYYNNIFGDYFLQTCISYYLGDAGMRVFEDFETDMMTRDPSLNLSKVRESAIDTCTKIVLEDPEEDFFAGWTLSCPANSDTLRSLPFEECILLLTDKALYFCRFDWNTEKVGSFERVNLTEIEGLQYGAYITSTLGPTHMDEKTNVGFVVRYRPLTQAMVRTNTRSLANEKVAEEADEEHQDQAVHQVANTTDATPDAATATKEKETKKETAKENKKGDVRILAFKALPPSHSARKEEDTKDEGDISEPDLVKHVCEEIDRLAAAAFRREVLEKRVEGEQQEELDKGWQVEAKDVIGLDEAKKSTGYLESLQYSLKKLVWA